MGSRLENSAIIESINALENMVTGVSFFKERRCVKGSIVILKRNEIEVRTEFLDRKTIIWIDGKKPLVEVTDSGYEVRPDFVRLALLQLEDFWDKSRAGIKIESHNLEEVIKILRNV